MNRVTTISMMIVVCFSVLLDLAVAELIPDRSARRTLRDRGELSRIASRSFRSTARREILDRSSGVEAAEAPRAPRRASAARTDFDMVSLERTVRYQPLIEHYSDLNDVDPSLVSAIIYTESGGDPGAVSSQGAAGLMQLMPLTAAELGVSDRHDAEQNIASGTRYLGQLMDRFGSTELALWAYNAGPTAVERGRIPRETRDYVPRVLRLKRALEEAALDTDDRRGN